MESIFLFDGAWYCVLCWRFDCGAFGFGLLVRSCWVIVLRLGLLDIRRHIPNKDGTFITYWNNCSLIWGYGNLNNSTWMAMTLNNLSSVIVSPYLYSFVFSSSNKVLSLFGNCNGVYSSMFISIEFSNNLAIKFFPIINFTISSNSKQLVLIRMKSHLLEICWLEKTNYSCICFKVPNNAWTIMTATYSLLIVSQNLDCPDSSSMFF